MNSYVIPFTSIIDKSAIDLVNLIKCTDGFPIRNLTVDRILFIDGKPIYPHGVYVFKLETIVQYVGKSSTNSLITRIYSHFDTRELENWGFNAMLKHIRRLRRAEMPDLDSCAKLMINKGQIILIPFDELK